MLMRGQMPRTMSDRLNRLDERNKALKTLLHSEEFFSSKEGTDVLLGPAAVGATELLQVTPTSTPKEAHATPQKP